MNRVNALFLALLLACPLVTFARDGGDAAATPANSTLTENKQFDFLLGQWDLEVHPKVSSLVAMIHGTPRLVGTWKASRSADGLGIEDEMRVVDASGNPLSSNHSLRVYDPTHAQWKVSGHDAQSGRSSEATGKMASDGMLLDGHFTETDGKQTMTRTRYYDITADGFHMQQDRSTDNGQSWDEAAITIDAKRAATSAAQ